MTMIAMLWDLAGLYVLISWSLLAIVSMTMLTNSVGSKRSRHTSVTMAKTASKQTHWFSFERAGGLLQPRLGSTPRIIWGYLVHTTGYTIWRSHSVPISRHSFEWLLQYRRCWLSGWFEVRGRGRNWRTHVPGFCDEEVQHWGSKWNGELYSLYLQRYVAKEAFERKRELAIAA